MIAPRRAPTAVTSNTAVSPSTALVSPIESFGGSLRSRMTPSAESSASAAPSGDDRFSRNVSSGSWMASVASATATVRLTSCRANVSVPPANA